MPLNLRTAIAVAAVAALTAPAAADPHSGIDSNLARPSFDAGGSFTVESGAVMERGDFSFKLGAGAGLAPLSVAVPGIEMDVAADEILDFVVALDMTAAFAFTDWLTIAINAGAYRTDTGPGYGERGRYDDDSPTPSTGLISLRPLSNIDPSGGFEAQGLAGPLDARAAIKIRLHSSSALDIAAVASASVPFGDEEMFLGDAGFVFEPKLALTWRPHRAVTAIANGGARFRERTVLEAFDPGSGPGSGIETEADARVVLDVGSEAVAAGAIKVEVGPRVVAMVEGTALIPLPSEVSLGSCRRHNGARCSTLGATDYFDGDYGDLVAIALAGVQIRATPDLTVELGAGAGLIGDRGDTARIWTGVTWQPGVEGTKRIVATDADGDGLGDSIDVCPEQAEDGDGFQDDDGCPDPDNDGDGIADGGDQCPEQAEDQDGFDDGDGCPEPDNDGDLVEDASDQCPRQKEDVDGFADSDGCPDPDNDGDGIADGADACPNQKETVNGFEDTDGCPDQRADTGPRLISDRIDLQGAQIAFTGPRSAALTSASRAILEDVAALIRAQRLRIRVEVHVARSTRSRNPRVRARAQAADLALSRRRAAVIRRYMIDRGAPLAAIRAVGLGSARTLKAPPTDPSNERIDFIRAVQ